MRNISCGIMFSSTFHVISRKFGLLFRQGGCGGVGCGMVGVVAMVVQVVVILLDVAVVVAVAKHGGHDGVRTDPESAALRAVQVSILPIAGLCTN